MLADVVDYADVGMVQSRRSLGFPLETHQRLLIAGYFFRQELKSHEAVQAGVFGLVHHPHTTTGDEADDAKPSGQ